jgi:hypothetical protein
MWPFSEMSLPVASLVGTIANWTLLASLIGGVLSTFVIVKTSDVKEEHWAEDRQRSNEHIAELNNEAARLRANELKVFDSLLANAHAGRADAIASEATRSVTEAFAIAQGWMKLEAASETTRALFIISKVAPFAGEKFDAVVTSSSIRLGGLLGSIKTALASAGWIEIERDDPAAGVGVFSMERGGGPALVRIDVDASKDSELMQAAEALASALNAEGIAATVEPKAETDATNASMIHIFVGPKP